MERDEVACGACGVDSLQRAAYMPTVVVGVEDPSDGASTRQLALTDGGSTGLIITDKLAKELKLPTEQRSCLVNKLITLELLSKTYS